MNLSFSKVKLFLALTLTIACYIQLSAQSMGPGAGSYSQNFAGLGVVNIPVWMDNSTIPGWYAQRTSALTTCPTSNGSASTGNLYNYGIANDADRSLGSIGSATAGHFAWGIRLQNNSNAVPNRAAITISYVGEQWRYGGGGSQTVSFYYQRSNLAITALQPNNNAAWIPVTALNFTSPITSGSARMLDGNAALNRVLISNTITFSTPLADGEYVLLKWDDPDQTGTDNGFSIDDVSIGWSNLLSLPISLSSFSAKNIDIHNHLYWSTLSEENNLYFEIESAIGENGFRPIGKINGAVNSQSKKDYTFIDTRPREGINYYRLKQVDQGGAYTYSKIISVSFSSKTRVQIFPNPISKELKMIFNEEMLDKFGIRDGIKIHLFDYTGKCVKTWTEVIDAREISLDISELSIGAYILKLEFENQIERHKIVKL